MMNNTKNNIININILLAQLLFIVTLSLSIYGLVILYSASIHHANNFMLYKQTIITIFSFVILAFIIFLDIKFIFKLSYLTYFIIIFLLILVFLFGQTSMGATRWLSIGSFKLQPSEFAKIAIILAMSKFIHNNPELSLKNIIKLLMMLLLPVLLILKQPDLGTSIIILFIAGAIIFTAGINIKYIIFTISSILISVPLLWNRMYDYQKKRVMIFLNPESDPLGAGYNIIQSKIAIGSGGIFGKGLFNGTQSHLKFLPEYHTDFIFSFLSEELGLIGVLILLILYSSLFIIMAYMTFRVKTKFAMMLIIGSSVMIFSHVFINIAMVMGLLPVVGVPLPFISYGGTMMLSSWFAIALSMNAIIHHNTRFLF